MKQLIAEQVQFILLMTVSGMALMLCYDVLRLFRWLFSHLPVVIVIEDFLFWLCMSVPVYYLFLVYHDGIIRWYGALSVFAGIILYEFGFSRPVRHLLAGLINPWRTRIRKKLHKIKLKIMVKLKEMSKKCHNQLARNKNRVYND